MAVSRGRSRKNERRTERMELRVRPSVKKLIERATVLSGRSLGDLAYEAALRVVDEHERIVLAGRDREQLLELVLNPPPPSPKLVAAIERHRKMTS